MLECRRSKCFESCDIIVVVGVVVVMLVAREMGEARAQLLLLRMTTLERQRLAGPGWAKADVLGKPSLVSCCGT